MARTPITPSGAEAAAVVDEFLARQRVMYSGGSIEAVAELMAEG